MQTSIKMNYRPDDSGLMVVNKKLPDKGNTTRKGATMALATILKHKTRRPKRRKPDQPSQIQVGLRRAGSVTVKPKQVRSRLDSRKRGSQTTRPAQNHI
jgi:hypothetical protein